MAKIFRIIYFQDFHGFDYKYRSKGFPLYQIQAHFVALLFVHDIIKVHFKSFECLFVPYCLACGMELKENAIMIL